MKAYNLYYKGEKFNNRPLLEKDLKDMSKVAHKGIIYKKDMKGNMIPIELKNISIVECTVV